jgi:hypothetical protein
MYKDEKGEKLNERRKVLRRGKSTSEKVNMFNNFNLSFYPPLPY